MIYNKSFVHQNNIQKDHNSTWNFGVRNLDWVETFEPGCVSDASRLLKAAEWDDWIDEDDKDISLLISERAFSNDRNLNSWPSQVHWGYRKPYLQVVLIIGSIYGAQVAWYVNISFFQADILTDIWIIDLFFLIRDMAFLVFWRGWSPHFPNDWLCGEIAGRVDINVDEV